MIQPAFCCEKYRSDSEVRCEKRSRRSSSTIRWPTLASPSQVSVPSTHAAALTPMYASTVINSSCSSPARMPSLVACSTRSQPVTGAAADRAASSAINVICPLRSAA
jgi:hypothetical protein